jgi:hypothetical protein
MELCFFSLVCLYGMVASLRTETVLCFYLLFLMHCVLNATRKNNLCSRKRSYVFCLTALKQFFLPQLINVKVSKAHRIAKKVHRKYVYSIKLHYLTCVQLRNSYNICCQLNRKYCVDPDGNPLGYSVQRTDSLSDGMDCSKSNIFLMYT